MRHLANAYYMTGAGDVLTQDGFSVVLLILSLDESWGYLGFSTVTPPPLQRFPFGRDNLKNILRREKRDN